MEKSLEFRPGYEGYLFALVTALILCLLEADTPTKERNSKQGTVKTYGLNSVNMFFILLTKVIAVYLRFLEIQVGKLSLERSFLGLSMS